MMTTTPAPLVEVHSDWATHPLVEHAATNSDDTLGALEALLSTMHELEERFPGVPFTEICDAPRADLADRADLASRMLRAGASPADVDTVCGLTTGPGRMRSWDDGLTDRERQIYALADLGLSSTQAHAHPLAENMTRDSVNIAVGLRRPLTDLQARIVQARSQGLSITEAAKAAGTSSRASVQTADMKARYHRSRRLHGYAT